MTSSSHHPHNHITYFLIILFYILLGNIEYFSEIELQLLGDFRFLGGQTAQTDPDQPHRSGARFGLGEEVDREVADVLAAFGSAGDGDRPADPGPVCNYLTLLRI